MTSLTYIRYLGILRQKQVSNAWISNCIPQNTIRCNYLPMPQIPDSSTKALHCPLYYVSSMNYKLMAFFYDIILKNCPYQVIRLGNADFMSRHLMALEISWWCSLPCNILTHWGRVTHICVNKLTITGSDNGLSPDRRQAIIWTNAGILLIGPLRTNFNESLVEI